MYFYTKYHKLMSYVNRNMQFMLLKAVFKYILANASFFGYEFVHQCYHLAKKQLTYITEKR